MKFSSTTLAPSITVVALGVGILIGFTMAQSSHSADGLTPVVTQAKAPVQQENVSLDYAKAHQALMRKPDEPTVSAF